jgi:hypothetical protein
VLCSPDIGGVMSVIERSAGPGHRAALSLPKRYPRPTGIVAVMG